MAYRRDPRGIRAVYEEHFPKREVRVQRVVNIVEKRAMTPPELEYDGGYEDDQWYADSRSYQDLRGYRGEGAYSSIDHGYMEDDFGSSHRNLSPPPHEDSYSYYGANRDDGHTRREVEIRSSGRGGPYFRSRGRGVAPRLRSMSNRGKHKLKPPHPYADRGESHGDYRRREPHGSVRVRSPTRKDALPPIPVRSPTRKDALPPIPVRSPTRKDTLPPIPVHSGSNTSSRSYSPDRENGYTYQQLHQRRYEDRYSHNMEPDESSVQTSDTPSNPVQGPPQSSVSSKENPPASLTETEELVAASTEPKLTTEEEFKARRAQAIETKALEIEKLYRQDCETFGTVVNMLVAKEPSLNGLLQAPLKENLTDLKQRCLDDLKHFIKELDQVIQQPETST